jgi:hypothetical protein
MDKAMKRQIKWIEKMEIVWKILDYAYPRSIQTEVIAMRELADKCMDILEEEMSKEGDD